MGSLNECRIEGFVCRLCSQIERNVIHIYTEEGLTKKLEQKINVYLKINLTRSDPLPKTICLPCDAKLEQHHRFIQRVIQNQKKIQGDRPNGDRPIIPLLEQHLRVRVSPVVREDGSGSNTYNIEAISSSESSDSDISEGRLNPQPDPDASEMEVLEEELAGDFENELADMENSLLSEASTPSQEPPANLSPAPDLELMNEAWSSDSSNSSTSSSGSDVMQ